MKETPSFHGKREGWFKREVRVDNLIIICALVGNLFVVYGKWVTMTEKVDNHEARIVGVETTQKQITEVLIRLTTLMDERTSPRITSPKDRQNEQDL